MLAPTLAYALNSVARNHGETQDAAVKRQCTLSGDESRSDKFPGSISGRV